MKFTYKEFEFSQNITLSQNIPSSKHTSSVFKYDVKYEVKSKIKSKHNNSSSSEKKMVNTIINQRPIIID